MDYRPFDLKPTALPIMKTEVFFAPNLKPGEITSMLEINGTSLYDEETKTEEKFLLFLDLDIWLQIILFQHN